MNPSDITQTFIRPLEGKKIRRVAPEMFLNREVSWLEFNRRVLELALDARTPLLERARFLSIFTSNLDEFVMKRVGGLNRQVAAGIEKLSPDGRTPADQLEAIRSSIQPMLAQQAECFTNDIRPALRAAGIWLLDWAELSDPERAEANEYFRRNVFPVLTPLAVDPGHPFPFISNLSKSLGVALCHPGSDERLFARVKIPDTLAQWCELSGDGDSGERRFIGLVDLIRHNIGELFAGMVIDAVMPFRVTRNADVERDEEDAEDLLDMIEQELRQRRFERAVRLEHASGADPWILSYLVGELQLGDDGVYEMPAQLEYLNLNQIADLGLPQHRYKPWKPIESLALANDDVNIFTAIRSGDILLHHPYESFNSSVLRFVADAADDPDVLAIKMTVYRTGDESPFINMLIRAAEAGKQVVCLVELKARFDEERNVQLAQRLEKAGVHVVYGFVGFKTHTKTALVVRREPDGLRTYVHIGTGNYHPGTANLYTDIGLLTCNQDFTEDVSVLFNHLTGRSLTTEYRKLLVAPVNMERRFYDMIERETQHAQAGRPGRIIAKMNSLEHRGICEMLYAASQAGVQIDLIVRGFCCLRPGVPGMSDNIRVMSVLGRYLEHSRIFYFGNAEPDPVDGEFYIGSADWMYRNLLARVEAITPIEQRAHRERLWQILEIMLSDQRQAWDMDSEGNYTARTPMPDSDAPQDIGTHRALMRLTTERRDALLAAAGATQNDVGLLADRRSGPIVPT